MIAIRRARLKDAAVLGRLKCDAFREKRKIYTDSPIDPDTESFPDFIKAIADHDSDYRVILYKKRKEDAYSVIGGIRVIPAGADTYCIAPFYLGPDYQDRGYGGKVLERVISKYPDAKAFKLTATLEDKAVVRFYEKHGFTFTGEKACLAKGATLGVFIRKIEPDS